MTTSGHQQPSIKHTVFSQFFFKNEETVTEKFVQQEAEYFSGK